MQGSARICNRVYKGKVCKKERNGCKFAHPIICNIIGCSSSNTCSAFHPVKPMGNGRRGARMGGGASAKGKPGRGNKGSNGSSSSSQRGSSSSISNPSNRNSTNGRNRRNDRGPTYSQLREKVTAMKLQLDRNEEIRKELRELKEMSSLQGTPVASSSSSNNTPYNAWWARADQWGQDVGRGTRGGDEGYAHAQLPPGLMDAVMAAVMTVMADRGHVPQAGEQRRCRC